MSQPVASSCTRSEVRLPSESASQPVPSSHQVLWEPSWLVLSEQPVSSSRTVSDLRPSASCHQLVPS